MAEKMHVPDRLRTRFNRGPSTDAQIDVLKVAGCAEIFREHMSGAKASRPELAKVLAHVRRSDVLVVGNSTGWRGRCRTFFR